MQMPQAICRDIHHQLIITNRTDLIPFARSFRVVDKYLATELLQVKIRIIPAAV
jgi:hypothetical protein